MTLKTLPLEQGQLYLAIALIHVDGTRLHPVAIRNRRTGLVAFNLAKSGTDSHHREAAIEITDEETVIRAIVDQRMKVRCQAINGDHKGQFCPDGRTIARIEHVSTGARP